MTTDEARKGQRERIYGILDPVTEKLKQHGIEGEVLGDIVNDLIQVGLEYELMAPEHKAGYFDALASLVPFSTTTIDFKIGKYSNQSYKEK